MHANIHTHKRFEGTTGRSMGALGRVGSEGLRECPTVRQEQASIWTAVRWPADTEDTQGPRRYFPSVSHLSFQALHTRVSTGYRY